MQKNRLKTVPISGNAILKIREAWKLSQQEFADVVGLRRETITRKEDGGFSTVRIDTLRKIAKAMGKTSEEAFSILTRLTFAEMNPDLKVPAVEIPPMVAPPLDGNALPIGAFAEIPTFDLSLAAGPWADVLDVPGACGPDSIDQGLFRVRLSGDSMSPRYKDGMIVEFERARHSAHEMLIGRDYYVQRRDGAATFKRAVKILDGTLYLAALNRRKYPKQFSVELDELVNLAIAKGVFIPIE